MKKTDNIIIKLLIVLIIILVIFFLNGEWLNLNISKKINHEKFNAFFTSLGAILTASSIYFLFRQTKMLQNERKLSVQPDLVPETTQLIIDERNPDQPKFKTIIAGQDMLKPCIKLHNVGLGVAKDIFGFWNFHVEENFIEKIINDYPNLKRSAFDFIPIIKSDLLLVNSSILCNIPNIYLIFFTTRFKMLYTQEEIPKLELSLSYTNNYNDRESKNFYVYFEENFNYYTINFALKHND